MIVKLQTPILVGYRNNWNDKKNCKIENRKDKLNWFR
jgi:hypothetical protein